MKISRGPTAFTVLLSIAAVLPLPGCEDGAARRRDELQSRINKASELLEQSGSAPSAEDAKRLLNEVASKVSDTAGGDAGQEAAASFLVAAARQELASILLGEAMSVEAELRQQRDAVRTELDGAARLAALADVHEGFSLSGPRSLLDEKRSSVQSRMEELQQRIAELDSPINDRESRIAQDAAEASQLREQANDLHRQARESGHAAGFETYLQAIRLDRKVDTFEIEIAQRETDLRFDLRPEQALAQRNVQHLQQLMTDIAETERLLEDRSTLTKTELSATRAVIDELRRHAEAAGSAIVSGMNGELNDLYGQAAQSLDQAEQQAQQAGRKSQDHREAALLAEARAVEAWGRLHWSRARGLQDQLALQQQLGNASAGDLASMVERELAQAGEAFTKATEHLAQVRSSDAAVGQFRTGVARAMASLKGEPMPGAPGVGSSGETMSSPGVSTAPEGGVASPQDTSPSSMR